MAKLSESLAAPQAATRRRLRERVSFWGLTRQLAPFALAFAAYLAAFLVMRPDTTGDEPHYLLVAQSIAFDHDVDLVNDYASRERTLRVVNVFPLDPAPHAADYDGSGQLRPLHGVGLSVLLAPAVAVGGLTGAQLAMVLVAALLADQLFRLLRDLRFRRRYRVSAWVAVAFCSPVLVFSSQIYPELPAALLLVVALRIMVKGASSPVAIALGSTAAAALVWLHVRYIPLALGVLLGLAFAACSARWERPANGRGRIAPAKAALRHCAATAWKDWREVTLPVVLPAGVGLGLLAVAFQYWYGTPDPAAPYRAYSDTTIGSGGWDFFYRFTLADFLNPVYGWLPFVPIHVLGLAALGCLLVRFGWPAAACLAVAVGYELILSSAGPNIGWGLPARYLLIVIPLIAVPIAVVLQEVRASRFVLVPLLAVSLVYAAAAVHDHLGLFPAGEKPRIFGARSTAFAFPVTNPPELPTSFVLAPGQFPPQTGKVQREGVIVATAGRDGPGFLLWGPYVNLKNGVYRASFPLAIDGVGPNEHVATIEAAGTPPPQVFSHKVVTAGELGDRMTRLTLEFKLTGGHLTETRVYYHGRGTLRAGPIEVQRIRPNSGFLSGLPDWPGAGPSSRFPDWPLVLLWVGGTFLAGWVFVRAMKRDGLDDELVGEQRRAQAADPVR